MKDEKFYLIHIGECIERVERYVSLGGKAAFMADSMMQDAVLRNLQTMAESTQLRSCCKKLADVHTLTLERTKA